MILYGLMFPNSGNKGPAVLFYSHEDILRWFKTDHAKEWMKTYKVISFFRRKVEYNLMKFEIPEGMGVDEYLVKLRDNLNTDMEIFSSGSRV